MFRDQCREPGTFRQVSGGLVGLTEALQRLRQFVVALFMVGIATHDLGELRGGVIELTRIRENHAPQE